MEVKHFGTELSLAEVPSLTEIQTKSYEDFLQVDVPFNRRADIGLEAILRETFPIYSYDKTMSLEYVGYELSRPRYTSDECRVLGQTYGMPFKIRVRLDKPDPVEEWVYLGEIPIMVGGGEFIINGAERVVVSQLLPGRDPVPQLVDDAGEDRDHAGERDEAQRDVREVEPEGVRPVGCVHRFTLPFRGSEGGLA